MIYVSTSLLVCWSKRDLLQRRVCAERNWLLDSFGDISSLRDLEASPLSQYPERPFSTRQTAYVIHDDGKTRPEFSQKEDFLDGISFDIRRAGGTCAKLSYRKMLLKNRARRKQKIIGMLREDPFQNPYNLRIIERFKNKGGRITILAKKRS